MSPYFSIIIPCRNEEKELPRCLAAIRSASEKCQESIEIIVVLNRCTDKTEEIAISGGCKIIKEDAKNLSKIRNAGAAAAIGKVIITVDADSRMSKNMLREIKRVLESGESVGGGVSLVPERLSLGIILTGLMLVPIVFYKGFISAGLFYTFKRDFDAIGGFNEELVTLEDVDFAHRLKAHGKKSNRKYSTLFRSHIITSCRKFDHFGDWYFLKNPKLCWRLINGKDKEAGNLVWYDFNRR